MGVIELKGLTKRYGRHRGVEDLNLVVERGEVFGFIGPNGAGKSTTIRMLINMLFPTSGTATVLGMDCVRDTKAIKAKVGYISSEVFYYDQLRVRELIDYTAGFYHGVDRRAVDALCARFELDVERKVEDLSLGNRKKVAIVLALLKDPELIILDEPTAGLDPLMQNLLFEVLLEQRGRGATIFLSSHNLPEVERYCDRVAVVREGRIVEVATVDDVVQTASKSVTLRTKDGAEERFTFDGDLDDLVRRLAGYELADLEVRSTSLEDSFMKYYERGEGAR